MSRSPQVTLIERLLPVALVIFIVGMAFLTLSPFLPAFLWGVMVAMSVEPRYQWLSQKLGERRVLAAWITGLVLTAAYVVPMIGLSRAMIAFLPDALNWLERQALSPSMVTSEQLQSLPAIGPQLSEFWHQLRTDASGLAAHFGTELKVVFIWILQEIELFGVFVFELSIGVVLAVIFVYRSERITELSGKFLDKIGGNFAQRLAAHSVDTTRQAVRGVLGAALVQTLVAAFSYVIAGVPGWMIWAGLTFILALVQVGPTLIWLPMSIWLWAEGHGYMALFVFLWGLIVVNLVDNIVRPLLTTKDTNFPATLAFLGAIGGLLSWGVVGVFLGPVIVAVGYELILKWIEPDTLPDETIT